MPGELKNLTVGSDLSVLDIYLSSGGNPVDASYVGFELFDAAGVSATSGIAINPTIGTYKASGVVPAGFQLGTWRIDWDIITGGGDYQSASEDFCVQAVNVKIGFDPAGSKTSDIYEAVRIDIGDPEGQIFDDQFLQRTLKKAVRRLNHRLGLSPTSRPQGIPGGFGGPKIKVYPIVADLDAGTITPLNDEICDLIVMQMEVIVLESEISALKRLAASAGAGPFGTVALQSGNDGITVRNADGVTVSISAGRLSFRSQLYQFDVKQRRQELEAAIKAFLNRMTGNFGKLIY